MSAAPLRVALFPDSYHEVNGVANTVRHFQAHAQQHGLPLLIVAGAEKAATVVENSITRLDLKRGPFSFGLDKDLRFDIGLLRHLARVRRTLQDFSPDLVHITGPSDVGILGTILAHQLNIPLVASWHTNVHEYAGTRLASLFPRSLPATRSHVAQWAEKYSFRITSLYYKAARLHFAPNQELIDQLFSATRRPCFLMSRGVDDEAFHPRFRHRQDDGILEIGYVGRLTTEKNVRDFAALGHALLQAGVTNFRFTFVGQGSSSQWLLQNVPNAVLAGVKKGEELARAYANFDLFVFPSRTDTFGNVVLEALASGVPAIVTDAGGPKFIVRRGECGLVAQNVAELAAHLIYLASHAEVRRSMSVVARQNALLASWQSVFASVYDAYESQLGISQRNPQQAARRSSAASLSFPT